MKVMQLRRRVNFGVNHFCKRFKQLQQKGDDQDRIVQALRCRLFLHFYRLLEKLDRGKVRNQKYLTFLYMLFDADQPKEMSKKESLKYREEFTGRLIALTEQLITINQNIDNDLEVLYMHTPGTKFNLSVQIDGTLVKIGFLNVVHMSAPSICTSRGFNWQQETFELNYMDGILESCRIVDLDNMKELRELTGNDLELYYLLNENSSHREYESYEQKLLYDESLNIDLSDADASMMDYFDYNEEKKKFDKNWVSDKMSWLSDDTDLEKIDSRQFIIKETVEVGTQLEQTELTSQAQQTENGIIRADRAVQTSQIVLASSNATNMEKSVPKLVQNESNMDVQLNVGDMQWDVNYSRVQDATSLGVHARLDTGLDQWKYQRKSSNLTEQPDRETEQCSEQPDLIPDPNLLLSSTNASIDASPILNRPNTQISDPFEDPSRCPYANALIETPGDFVEPIKTHPMPELSKQCQQMANGDGQGLVDESQWQHKRYVLVASRFIIQSFKLNPAYQYSAYQPDGPDFFEQLTQFYELIFNRNTGIDFATVRHRIGVATKRVCDKLSLSMDQCFTAIKSYKLDTLLTRAELSVYESLRWEHRDRGVTTHLTDEERLTDALHAMLGYECQQLHPLGQRSHLALRSPHYQNSVSESYLLLAIAQLGHYYRCLQQQQLKLAQLGDVGRALVPCLLAELRRYLYFYESLRKRPPKSLLHLFWSTRSYMQRFQWLLLLCLSLGQRKPVLWCLQQQLGRGNADCDKLVRSWLHSATMPLLAKITDWMVTGELPHDADFFITRRANSVSLLSYWTQHFQLAEQQLPHFLSQRQAQQLISIGRNQHYARQFMDNPLMLSLSEMDLHRSLSTACARSYLDLDMQPLNHLIDNLHLEIGWQLLELLHLGVPNPPDLLSGLHHYLLLTNLEFARKLTELLEPVLEQPSECFDVYQLNSMMEQVLMEQNKDLYADAVDRGGSLCWSRFQLRWRLPTHWQPLLGNHMVRFESCSAALWELNYADYVLNERMKRQQAHFSERIRAEYLKEARQVRNSFDQAIDRLTDFMDVLRNFLLDDILAGAYERLYLGCKLARSPDDLLQLIDAYLGTIEWGICLGSGKSKSCCRRYLSQLYSSIIQLDAVQQRFLSLCQLRMQLVDYDEAQHFRWTCQNTCDAICDVVQQFQQTMAKFLLALHYSSEPQLLALARKFDAKRYYESRYSNLKIVHTFSFQRKLKAKAAGEKK